MHPLPDLTTGDSERPGDDAHAAARWTAGAVRTLHDGVVAAESALDSGKASAVLDQLCVSTV